jgi:hypothetical protein
LFAFDGGSGSSRRYDLDGHLHVAAATISKACEGLSRV